MKSIAILDPIGDYGMGVYTHELSEGLAANNLQVDVYTSGKSVMPRLGLPLRHALFPVLGSLLWGQGDKFEDSQRPAHTQPENALKPGKSLTSPPKQSSLRRSIRQTVLPIELAIQLKRKKYDLIWSQWPVMTGYGTRLWRFLRLLGMRVVHTVHDVLPHESEDWAWQEKICKEVYETAEALIVHSQFSKRELGEVFPRIADKILVARHGLYTVFPRNPDAREAERSSLNIGKNEVALLYFGGIRPYKNLDSIMQAMRGDLPRNVVLIIAGWEYKKDCEEPQNRLAMTMKSAEEMGIAQKVRFVPGPLDFEETARIFEASDILLQPYLKSHGSGLLLLGMTFQKHILATATGGMDEYLAGYPQHTLIPSPGPEDIARGIERALPSSGLNSGANVARIPELEWPLIARETISTLQSFLRI